jgi:hypothetical protein
LKIRSIAFCMLGLNITVAFLLDLSGVFTHLRNAARQDGMKQLEFARVITAN